MVQLDTAWVRQNLPALPPGAHKGNRGTLGILAGSLRYRGVALLAARGALRAGAGIVRLGAVEAVCAAAAVAAPGCVLWPMEQTDTGGIAAGGLAAFLQNRHTALLAGCGMTASQDTALLVEQLLQEETGPLVLDADALNVLAGRLETGEDPALARQLQGLLGRASCILTPHIGEMARLCGETPEAIAQDQAGAAQRFATAHRCTVVLKSHQTVIAGPDGTLYLNGGTGNPGLAKGGSGDVLAGIIAALAAGGLPGEKAAAAGVWLHAAAGQTLAAQRSLHGMLPAELPDALCDVWLALERADS